TTKAAAVSGPPPCHPNTTTAAAPIANSVNQSARTTQSSVSASAPTRNARRSPRSATSLFRRRPRRPALEETSDELLEAAERVETPFVEQRLVRVVREDDRLVIHVVRPQQLHPADRLRELDVAVAVHAIRSTFFA